MTSPALIIDHLTVTYGNGHRALHDVSFLIDRGENLGVVGASGSGKTTLLRAIMGLLPATAQVHGQIVVDGVDLVGLSRRERRRMYGNSIGFVAQDPFAACDPLRRVRHHVEEAWAAHRVDIPEGMVVDGLTAMGIPDAADRCEQRPHQWSGGMLQRATVLAATVHHPVLTLADEPTSALDTELADDALDLLQQKCSALLLVTHDLALASRHTNRIVVLDDGDVVEEGPSCYVLAEPEHPTTQRLVRSASPQPCEPDESLERPVVLTAEGISKTYTTTYGHDVPAVRTTSLEVRAREVLGLVGPSGAGKSTLLRVLAGMERPDSGSLRAGDHELWSSSGSVRMPRPGFAMPIFQDPVASLDPRWPLWRTLTEPLVITNGRMRHRDRRERAADEMASLGLDDIDVDRLPGSLSVGQCQRVAILRALIAEPAVLAADEPTASLDVEAAATVSDLLRAAADRGTAVVVVTHDEPRLRSYADRVLRIVDGEIHPADKVVAT